MAQASFYRDMGFEDGVNYTHVVNDRKKDCATDKAVNLLTIGLHTKTTKQDLF